MRVKCPGRLAVIGWAFLGCTEPVGSAPQEPFALTGLIVFDGTGAPQRTGQTIVVDNGLVAYVGPDESAPRPDDIERINLQGKFAVPGFIDVHAHMPAPEHQPSVLSTLLAFGITTARSTAAVPATGTELRARLEREELHGPRFLTAGRLIDGPDSPWGFAVEVATEEEVRAEVARQWEDGVDFIKLYTQIPPQLVAAAIEEAHARGLKVIGHLGRTTWGEAAAFGIDALTHSFVYGFAHSAVPAPVANQFAEFFQPNPAFDPALFDDWDAAMDFDAERFAQLAGQLAVRRIALDPNLVLAEATAWGDDPDVFARLETHLDAVPHPFPHPYSSQWSAADREAARAAFPRFLDAIRILHERGVLLTVGTDLQNPWMTPGVSFHRELQLLVEAGIPAIDVLVIATRNGAESLGILEEAGTIEVGKIADIIVLDDDPLADIGNTRAIYRVVRQGTLLEPERLLTQND